jgi:putative transposase
VPFAAVLPYPPPPVSNGLRSLGPNEGTVTDVITDKGCQDARRGRGGAGRVGPGAGRAVGGSARSQGLRLTGEDGLLAQLTKTIIESAAEGEMDDHLGSAKHDPARRDGLKCV